MPQSKLNYLFKSIKLEFCGLQTQFQLRIDKINGMGEEKEHAFFVDPYFRLNCYIAQLLFESFVAINCIFTHFGSFCNTAHRTQPQQRPNIMTRTFAAAWSSSADSLFRCDWNASDFSYCSNRIGARSALCFSLTLCIAEEQTFHKSNACLNLLKTAFRMINDWGCRECMRSNMRIHTRTHFKLNYRMHKCTSMQRTLSVRFVHISMDLGYILPMRCANAFSLEKKRCCFVASETVQRNLHICWNFN